MKLNPEELVVDSFLPTEPTLPGEKTIIDTIGPYDPTPMTYCYWCPPRTIECQW